MILQRDQYGMFTAGPRAGTHTSPADPVYLARHADTGDWCLYVYTPQTDDAGVPLEYCEMPARSHLVRWMRAGRSRKVARFLRDEGSLRDGRAEAPSWWGSLMGLLGRN